MRSLAALLISALVMAAAGGLLWAASRAEERRVDAEHALVTLRYTRAAEEMAAVAEGGVLDPILRRLSPGADTGHAVARYWSGDYQGLATPEDATRQLLAANADYRALRAAGGPWQLVVGRLDAIAKRYADILRVDPASEDAAYNYEFVLKLRAGVLRARQLLPAGDPATAGLTLHGDPGAPPRDSDAKKFRMIVPMLPDERQEAEEAGRTGQKVRKG